MKRIILGLLAVLALFLAIGCTSTQMLEVATLSPSPQDIHGMWHCYVYEMDNTQTANFVNWVETSWHAGKPGATPVNVLSVAVWQNDTEIIAETGTVKVVGEIQGDTVVVSGDGTYYKIYFHSGTYHWYIKGIYKDASGISYPILLSNRKLE